MRNQQEIICRAVRAISNEWTLNQIARLIYNMTNEKQNGATSDARAAKIISESEVL